jgi:hypothetical protein
VWRGLCPPAQLWTGSQPRKVRSTFHRLFFEPSVFMIGFFNSGVYGTDVCCFGPRKSVLVYGSDILMEKPAKSELFTVIKGDYRDFIPVGTLLVLSLKL